MDANFINLTPENLAEEHICCIIRSKKAHPGIDSKKAWLSDRLAEGHVFRKLDAKATVFIEYAPLETAWVPISGDNYIYIYCMWVTGAPKGGGYGTALMGYCIADAKAKGKSGICMLGSKKQKNWLSNQSFAGKCGFDVVDSTDYGYDLLALSFDGTMPQFMQGAKNGKMENPELTIYYDMQCPFIYQNIEKLQAFCDDEGIPADFIRVGTLEQAKGLPCVFNNYGVFYNGKFETVNQIDAVYIKRLSKN